MIARRVARLEGRLIPQEDPETKRLVELLRERRRRRLEAEGLPFEEPPLLPPTSNGRPWTLREILHSGRTDAVGSQGETAK